MGMWNLNDSIQFTETDTLTYSITILEISLQEGFHCVSTQLLLNVKVTAILRYTHKIICPTKREFQCFQLSQNLLAGKKMHECSFYISVYHEMNSGFFTSLRISKSFFNLKRYCLRVQQYKSDLRVYVTVLHFKYMK